MEKCKLQIYTSRSIIYCKTVNMVMDINRYFSPTQKEHIQLLPIDEKKRLEESSTHSHIKYLNRGWDSMCIVVCDLELNKDLGIGDKNTR